MSISRTLIKLRKERGWSQERLATVSGVSERTIQRLENDGTCSLETKMALASAFEIPPSELHEAEECEDGEVEFKTDWGGAVGLFILGLAAPIILLLIATSARMAIWEVTSFFVVIGLTVMLSIMSHGLRETYKLFDNTSWIVKYPLRVSGLNEHIAHARIVIENAYLVGLVASLITGLALAIHGSGLMENVTEYAVVVVKPLVYAVLFVEFWFRPYKRKMERMLRDQLNKSSG